MPAALPWVAGTPNVHETPILDISGGNSFTPRPATDRPGVATGLLAATREAGRDQAGAVAADRAGGAAGRGWRADGPLAHGRAVGAQNGSDGRDPPPSGDWCRLAWRAVVGSWWCGLPPGGGDGCSRIGRVRRGLLEAGWLPRSSQRTRRASARSRRRASV